MTIASMVDLIAMIQEMNCTDVTITDFTYEKDGLSIKVELSNGKNHYFTMAA